MRFLSFDKRAQDGIHPRLIATAIRYLEARLLVAAGLVRAREITRGAGKGDPTDFK